MRDNEKKITTVPELSISADERPERRQGKAPKQTTVSQPPRAVAKKSGNGMFWLLLLMIIAMGGAGFWQFSLLQQDLKETRSQLQSAKENLNQVTGEVSATGENLNQKNSSIRSELKELDSEIRKLWDVSNKRNRQWILINKDNVVKAQKTADVALEMADSANASADKINKNLNTLNADVKESDQILKTMSTEQVASQSEMTVNMDALRKQVAELESLLAQQKKRNSEFEKRIKDQKDAVKSMDSFRQQVNRKVLQLEGTVREFTQPPERGLGLE